MKWTAEIFAAAIAGRAFNRKIPEDMRREIFYNGGGHVDCGEDEALVKVDGVLKFVPRAEANRLAEDAQWQRKQKAARSRKRKNPRSPQRSLNEPRGRFSENA